MKQTTLRVGGIAAGLLALVCGLGLRAQDETAAPVAVVPSADDPSILEAEVMPRVMSSLILDIVDAGDRAVAVGERGHILVSETRRDGWRQIEHVPTRSTLTAVTAVGPRVFAVGHDSIVLRSDDGGLTWARKRVVLFDRNNPDPRNGAPLLDVLFTDADHGFAVGAYATLLRTDDGGESWNYVDILNRGDAAAPTEEQLAQGAAAPSLDDDSWNFDAADLDLDEETDPHLNGIARTGNGNLFVVAERGAAFRSLDGGATWQRIQLPYEGSMFGVIGGAGDHVLCFGLRGNVFESDDLGSTWNKRETATELSLMGGATGADGSTVLVGGNGIVLSRSSDSAHFLATTHPDSAVLSSVLVLGPGEYTVVGETGVSFFQP
ncbi:MAG: hypothetical protein IPF83_03190 [Rhodanobacteraceae bacterium]|nr:hypothetical protein [Rhodanobacteraceae bacterium]MBP9154845.1 hypothetical protein [Xanthomonadales bacterium]HQW81289.1 YCF48-related protein [Pseudomonadota bacterium]